MKETKQYSYTKRVLLWAMQQAKKTTVQAWPLSNGRLMVCSAYAAYVLYAVPDALPQGLEWMHRESALYQRMVRAQDFGTPVQLDPTPRKDRVRHQIRKIYDFHSFDSPGGTMCSCIAQYYDIVKPVTKWTEKADNIIVCFDDNSEPVAAIAEIVRR